MVHIACWTLLLFVQERLVGGRQGFNGFDVWLLLGTVIWISEVIRFSLSGKTSVFRKMSPLGAGTSHCAGYLIAGILMYYLGQWP